MRFVFDLDSVIRNLHEQVLGFIPTIWDYTSPDGRNMWQLIDDNFDSLINSNPTEYYSVIHEYSKIFPITIWTAQPVTWRNPTEKWIRTHFSNEEIKDIQWLTPEEKYYTINKMSECILVEDYPNFPKYDKIALVTFPYNWHISSCYAHVRNPQDMEQLLFTTL